MKNRWKERMKRLAEANEEERRKTTRRYTKQSAARVLEGLLSEPLYPPTPSKDDHPVSLSHRMRERRNV